MLSAFYRRTSVRIFAPFGYSAPGKHPIRERKNGRIFRSRQFTVIFKYNFSLLNLRRSLEIVSNLLGCNLSLLNKYLCSKKIKAGNEVYEVPLVPGCKFLKFFAEVLLLQSKRPRVEMR